MFHQCMLQCHINNLFVTQCAWPQWWEATEGTAGFSWAPHSKPGLHGQHSALTGSYESVRWGQQAEPATPHSHQTKRHPPWALLLGHFLLSSIPPLCSSRLSFQPPLSRLCLLSHCILKSSQEQMLLPIREWKDGKAPTVHRGSCCEVDLTDAARPRNSGHLELASHLCEKINKNAASLAEEGTAGSKNSDREGWRWGKEYTNKESLEEYYFIQCSMVIRTLTHTHTRAVAGAGELVRVWKCQNTFAK